ncbi:MAG: glutamate--tRNA ligase [Gammaproteobacteria bacterium]|jgi:glutamyl-tRNA synthetase
MSICTRFAPSPTGYLHIGSARTALFSWLYARKLSGTFILRIEDTDLERSTQASKQIILDAMAWMNLNYDQGPIYQTDRFPQYHAVINQLIESGHAYRCYCSKDRLAKLREQQSEQKLKPRYDGHCRNLADYPLDKPHVIRFRNPLEGEVVINDAVKGVVVIANAELDDLIIAREDGSPTYNLTVVVDDADMKVTHVIRGDDHLNNTPRQINIFLALGLTPPQFAHIPMILGHDGKRLSKRHGAVSVLQYQEMGVLPEALLNYLARLGWSHGDQEIFTMDELIEYFNIEDVHKSAATFDEKKLLWVNQQYLKTVDPESMKLLLAEQFSKANIDTANGPDVADVFVLMRERVSTLSELVAQSKYFYQVPEFDKAAVEKFLTQDAMPILKTAAEVFAKTPWEVESLHKAIEEICNIHNVKMGKVGPPIRVAVTGNTQSPTLDQTLYLIGKDQVVARIEGLAD